MHRTRLWALLFCALFPLLFYPGCVARSTSESLVQTYAAVSSTDSKADEIEKLNTQLFAAANLNVDPGDYLLGPGDLIEVRVLEAESLGCITRVSSRGYVSLPLLNEVRVMGLSTAEAEAHIETLFRKKYIKDPHVSVFVKEHFSQRITLVGEVKNPGTYDYMAKQRLLDVLALAGGLKETAGSLVQVRRSSAAPDSRRVYIVDLDRLIKEGAVELNIAINGGDVIFVPEAGMFFVDGAVRKPGSYPLKSKMNLQEAILAAGGFAPYAERNEVTIIRNRGKEGREIIRVDLEKDPTAHNIEVNDRDVIIAKDSAWGKMVHGAGINIGIPGFLGIGYHDPAR